jgi:hypothetical protein
MIFRKSPGLVLPSLCPLRPKTNDIVRSVRSARPSEFGSGDFDRVERTLLSVAFDLDFDSVVDSDFDRGRHGLSHAKPSQMVPASAAKGNRFPLKAQLVVALSWRNIREIPAPTA